MKQYNDFEPFSKDQAYWERNQLVCALSKIFPSWIESHPESDEKWDDDWRTIVFISIPNYQLSWHIHKNEIDCFSHLQFLDGNSWDGHTTEEKYKRLQKLDKLWGPKW